MNSILENTTQFRDTMSNIDDKGKRIWIYPKKPKGRFHSARVIVSIVLLAIFFINPLIKINGEPLFLFNIFERKFVFFGVIFWPQDFHLLLLATLTFFVFIGLFTTVFGRVWCGWACPQTVFMEMVFRKIEYWIEGDMNQQRKLDQAPWNREKILKKGAKQLIFVLISILIAHTLLAYIIGLDQVLAMVTTSPSHNWSGFVSLIVFTAVFYFVFAKLREQACTVICPYGRLQSVLLTRDTIVVAYDWLRGEPRKKITKKQAVTPTVDRLGDCIDCKLCVQVCPTGIDIRNGTQMECVNCTACIDACDDVMDKINRPRGLIRFDSITGIEEKKKFRFSSRIIGYSVVLFLLSALTVILLINRSDVETTVLRVPGMLYQKQENNRISNLYNFQLINKSVRPIDPVFKLKGSSGEIQMVGKDVRIEKNSKADGTFFIILPQSEIKSIKTNLTIEVYNEGKLIDEINTNFLGGK